jgi:hypothetical protein
MPADQIRNRTVGCKMSDSEYERLSGHVGGGPGVPGVVKQQAGGSLIKYGTHQ